MYGYYRADAAASVEVRKHSDCAYPQQIKISLGATKADAWLVGGHTAKRPDAPPPTLHSTQLHSSQQNSTIFGAPRA